MGFNQNFDYDASQAQHQGEIDVGLGAYMRRVYNWMGLGLVITASLAWAVAHTSLEHLFFSIGRHGVSATPFGWLVTIAPLGFVFVLSFGINRLSRPMAEGLFVLYSACMGLSLSMLLLVYTGASVFQTFLITALMFLSLSFYGYVTGRSLSGMRTFLFMGLVGLIIAGIANFFIVSGPFQTLISFVGVLIFAGLTAYDTQRIKVSYQQYLTWMPQEAVAKQSIYDALSLYLDFVNLFVYLLQFFGNGNSRD